MSPGSLNVKFGALGFVSWPLARRTRTAVKPDKARKAVCRASSKRLKVEPFRLKQV